MELGLRSGDYDSDFPLNDDSVNYCIKKSLNSSLIFVYFAYRWTYSEEATQRVQIKGTFIGDVISTQ